jgi:hypothetical protein
MTDHKNELPTDDLHFKVYAWANRAMDEGIDPKCLQEAMSAVAIDMHMQMLGPDIVADTLRQIADAIQRREHMKPGAGQ